MKAPQILTGTICACGLLVGTALATPDIDIGINTTFTQTSIPAEFLGFSFTRQYIGTDPALGIQRLFDVSAYEAANGGSRTNYDHFTNLIKQMGIKHYRTICAEALSSTPDPLPADDDIFFDFCADANLTGGIYSLHVFGEGDGAPNTSNTTAAQHILSDSFDLGYVEAFALDNESDWNYRIRCTHSTCPCSSCPDPYITDYTTSCSTDPNFTGMSAGYRGKWEKLKSQISALTNGSAAMFVGPDTGSSYPAAGSTDTTVLPHPGGTAFTLQFAKDESARIIGATQHHYEHNDTFTDTETVEWVAGAYLQNDIVVDPNDKDAVSGYERMYKSKQDNLNSVNSPKNATAYWLALEPAWNASTSYNVGDIVRDDSQNGGDGTNYQCITAGVGSHHPSEQNPGTHWTPISLSDRSTYGILTSHQLSKLMADPAVLTGWGQLDGVLSGTGWPSGMTFRMTEFSPYAGGQNPAAANFASALWGLEAFHWWARKGCVGVDPHSRPVQTNSPIYQAGGNYSDFTANPYAYAFAAFNISGVPGSGKELWATNGGITVTNHTGYNATAYAVYDTSDLFVTIINKTFDADSFSGSHSLSVKIDAPTGFTPHSVRYMVLNSGGAAGDSTVLAARLGGNQILNTTATFPQSWTTGSLSGGTVTVTVPAFSAIIVDLKP